MLHPVRNFGSKASVLRVDRGIYGILSHRDVHGREVSAFLLLDPKIGEDAFAETHFSGKYRDLR